ncbi:MAG: PhzF family phenazine biosynthesis protein [Burkholderiaceae bacterium]
MNPTSRRFIQVDVFSPRPTQGNALAVVVDGHGLSDVQCQRFAAWTNLAETTFLLPPSDARADYKVRIFTPIREMPFAGHPTLGSCAAWLHAGGQPKQDRVVRQECGVGLIDIEVGPDTLAFAAPPTIIEPMSAQQFSAITSRLDIPARAIVRTAQLNNGPVWQAFQLACADDVLAIDSSRVRWPAFKSIGFIGPHLSGAPCDFEVRMLAPSSGMREDPITGSLISALASWMRADGHLTGPISIAQGSRIERYGRVAVRPDETSNQIFIGGHTHVLIDGTVIL